VLLYSPIHSVEDRDVDLFCPLFTCLDLKSALLQERANQA